MDFIQHDTPIVIRFAYAYHSQLSDTEFNILQSKIRSNPEHPSKSQYDRELRIRADGPEVVEHVVCVLDGRLVRYNTSSSENNVYADIGIDGDTAWQMSRGQLTLVPADSDLPNDAPAFKSRLEQIQREFGYLWSNGRTMNLAMRVPDWEQSEGDTLIAKNEKLVLEYRDDGNAATVKVIDSETYPDIVNSFWVFDNRGDNPNIHTSFSKRMVEYSSSGSPVRSLEILSIQPTTTQVAQAYRKTPTLNGSDPFRGDVTFTGVYDYRHVDPKITVQANGGAVTVNQSSTGKYRANRNIRVIGWITAGVLVSSLIILRLKNSK